MYKGSLARACFSVNRTLQLHSMPASKRELPALLKPLVSKLRPLADDSKSPGDPVRDWHCHVMHGGDNDLSSSIGLEFDVWEGALNGIVHVKGQFAYLTDGSKQSELPKAPSEGLAEDLRLLQSLHDRTKELFYDALGSESEYEIMPLIVEDLPETQGDEGAEVKAAEGKTEGEDVAQLTPVDIYRALGVTSEAAATFRHPLAFDTPDSFLKYLHDENLKLSGTGADPMRSRVYEVATELVEHVTGPLVQLFAGNDGLCNPVLLIWIGRSRHRHLIGLLTGVIWT